MLLLAKAGVGSQGSYDSWSIGFDVTERFRPLETAKPFEGAAGQLSQVRNRRLEFHVPTDQYPSIIQLIQTAHPYETPAIEVIPLLYPL